MGSLYKQKQTLADGTKRELPTWWIKYYQHGRPVRESTGTTKETVARRILRRREGDVEHGIPVNPKMDRVTFEDASQDLLNDYSTNKKKSYVDTKRRVELHLSPFFKGKRLISITPALIRQYIAARQEEKAANGTINRELAALKRMFNLAIDAGKLQHKPKIPMLRENNARSGFFEREQFDSVKAHLPAPLQPVVTFAYLTGWRLKSEILPLKWGQVDWQGRTVRLDPGTTKNREGRTFPFTADLEQLLTTQWAEHERLKQTSRVVQLISREEREAEDRASPVFHRAGVQIKNLRGAWKTACKAAGVPGRIVHDFRRTAVRNLERDGVPRSAAMAMVGHKTEAIYRRYAIVDAGMLREAAAKIDRAASI